MSNLTRGIDRLLLGGDTAVLHDQGRWFTSAELAMDVAGIEVNLKRQGFQSGQRIMLALPNSYEFATVYLALLHMGLIVVPANPVMPGPELERFLASASVEAVFTSRMLEDDWSTILENAGFVRGDSTNQETNCEFWLTPAARTEIDTDVRFTVSEGTTGVLMFTSGTTGQPKGVELTHRQLMSGVQNVVSSHQLTAEDVGYCILPLFHINGQVIVFLSTLLSGGKLVMSDRFHASTFWSDVAEHGVTWVSCVPTILSIVAKLPRPSADLSTLRFLRSASAPLSPAILARVEQSLGIPVIESYGMTEAAGQICINPLPPGRRKLGSVGQPFGLELWVIDDSGEAVEPGQIGEIIIRGANVIESYLGNVVGAKHAAWTGWIYTGDLGYQDADGYVFITGRAKEIINRAGEKLSPREIEDVLNAHDAVSKSAVIGSPDPLYGERVVAYIVQDDDHALPEGELIDELRLLCLQSLAKYKCPEAFFVRKSLPVGPTGKIQKHLLKLEAVETATGTQVTA